MSIFKVRDKYNQTIAQVEEAVKKFGDMLDVPPIAESDELTPSGSVKLWYQTAYMPVKDRIKVPSLWPPPDKKFFAIIALLEAVERDSVEHLIGWLRGEQEDDAAQAIISAALALRQEKAQP